MYMLHKKANCTSVTGSLFVLFFSIKIFCRKNNNKRNNDRKGVNCNNDPTKKHQNLLTVSDFMNKIIVNCLTCTKCLTTINNSLC